MKKGAIVIIISLILSLFVVVAEEIDPLEHTGGVIWSNGDELFPIWQDPWVLFEFNTSELIIAVSNAEGSDDNITFEEVTPNGTLDESPVVFNNVIEKDQISFLRLDATVDEVDDDQDFLWNIRLVDKVGVESNHQITLRVINDIWAPRYALNNPIDRDFVQNIEVPFTLYLTEKESGFSFGNVLYDWYGDVTTSSAKENITICGHLSGNLEDALCEFTVDLDSQLYDGPDYNPYFNFYFNFTDKAKNANYSFQRYWLFVDDDEPEVNIYSPDDNNRTNLNSIDFKFSFDDNSLESSTEGFDPEVNCSVEIDGSYYDHADYDESDGDHELHSLGALIGDLDDGTYTWLVKCVDSADWAGQNETRTIIVDRTGPVITLVPPAENDTIIANGTLIEFTFTDELGDVGGGGFSLDGGATIHDFVNPVWEVPTDEYFSEGVNDLGVCAVDDLDNEACMNYTFTLDVIPPDITLVSPGDGNFGNGTFKVIADDDYSTTFDCQLKIDGEVKATETVTDELEVVFFHTFTVDGDYQWNVSCTDGVGNQAEVAPWTVKIDTTKPVITLEYPITNVQAYDINNINSDGTSDFNYSYSDDNPDSCTLNVDGSEIIAKPAGENFLATNFGLAARNEAYEWNLVCNDLAGNVETSATNYVYYDDSPPEINNLTNTNVTHEEIFILWNTNEITSNKVYYATNKTELLNNLSAQSSVEGEITTESAIKVTGLDATTTYYYLVVSCDQFDQCSNSSDQIDGSTFNTTATPAAPTNPSSGGGGGGSGRTKTDCNDRNDNDGDGLIDMADPGCDSKNDDDETDPVERACTPLWRCTDWDECTDEKQTRTCQDWNVCGTDEGKPDEQQSCEVERTTTADTEELARSEPETPLGVGAAVGIFDRIKGNWKGITAAAVVLGLLALAGWQREALSSGVKKVWNMKGARTRKEEEEIRKKLKEQGLIK